MGYNYCIHTSRRAINYQIWCNKGGFFAGIFMASTNLLFALLAISGKNYSFFAFAVIIDDIAVHLQQLHL